MGDEFYIFSLLQILEEQGTHKQGYSPKTCMINDVTKNNDHVAHHQMQEASGSQEIQGNIQEDSNLDAEMKNVQELSSYSAAGSQRNNNQVNFIVNSMYLKVLLAQIILEKIVLY